jgi:hypothetical protein
LLAVQVTVVVPTGKVDPEAGVHVGVSAPSTGSVAVTVKLTFAPPALVAAAVMFAGTTITGGRDWVTVTVNVFVPVLPRLSVALHVTVVVPIANVDPEAGVHVTAIAPSSGSVAEAANVTCAPPGIVAATAMFAGTVTVGAAPGSTVTVNDVLPETPSWAVAVQLTVVAPIGKVEPDAGVHATGSVTPPPTGSVATGDV